MPVDGSSRGRVGRPRPGGATTGLSSRVRAGRTERVVVIVVMFALAYNLPYYWFTKLPSGTPPPPMTSGENLMALILLGAAGFAFVNLRCDPLRFVDLGRAEPLLPILLGLAVVSSLWSEVPSRTFEVSVSLVVVTVFGYWLVIRFTLSDIIGLTAIVMSIGAFAHAGMVLVRPELGASGRGWIGLLDHRNNLGASAALGMVVCMLAARIHRRHRVACWVMAFANAALVVRSNSKTALVVAAALPAMMLLFTAFRARRTLYAVVVICLGASTAAVAVAAVGNLDTVTAALGREADLTGRTDIWRAALPVIAERPWLGHGWAGFFTGHTGPSRDLWLQFHNIAHAHNALIQYALDLGLVGAALAVAVFVRLVVRAARVVRFHDDAAGLFPLTFATYALLQSISEPGVIARGLPFVLLVVAISTAARGRRDVLALTLRAAAPPLPRPADPPARSLEEVREVRS